jgi:hypothetical protein
VPYESTNRRYFDNAVPIVELVPSDAGLAGEDLMYGGDPEAAAISGADVVVVEPGGDRLEAHRPAVVDPVQGHAVDAPHRVGMNGVDLKLLLDLRPRCSAATMR